MPELYATEVRATNVFLSWLVCRLAIRRNTLRYCALRGLAHQKPSILFNCRQKFRNFDARTLRYTGTSNTRFLILVSAVVLPFGAIRGAIAPYAGWVGG